MVSEDWIWRTIDCVVAVLSLPSLLLLGILLFSHEDPRTPAERCEILVIACLLLLFSVTVCCYVTRRLGLSCCIIGQYRMPTHECEKGLRDQEHFPLNSYDAFVNMEQPPSYGSVCGSSSSEKSSGLVEPCSVHFSKSAAQRASRDQGCYQNLRPQEDNG